MKVAVAVAGLEWLEENKPHPLQQGCWVTLEIKVIRADERDTIIDKLRGTETMIWRGWIKV